MTDNNNPKFRDVIRRMRRIEGQARGITGMMEEGRYCVDILQQILALEAAARAARTKVLDIHTKHCIEQALASNMFLGGRQDAFKFLLVLLLLLLLCIISIVIPVIIRRTHVNVVRTLSYLFEWNRHGAWLR